ncbi:MAG: hypothetical protein JF593_13525 [Novosphingobium sp.]|nr:hypothetical protein [Novosphingobium sp.]
MELQGDELHVETDEARSGSTPHIVRYVLVISLFLAIAALTVIWVTGAFSAAQGSRVGDVTNQAPPSPAYTEPK